MPGPAAELAPAKVNLALHVTGRRPDGLHLLDSLVVFPRLGDLVEAEPAADLSLAIDGPFARDLSAGADNLVLRAALLLGRRGRGAALRLTKSLPVASGIGGGSADAAATLRLLARLWQAPLPAPEAVLALGADLPVCLAGRPCRMSGIGERLAPLALPPFWLVLANPGVPLATAAVFAGLASRSNPPLPAPPAFPDRRGALRLARRPAQRPRASRHRRRPGDRRDPRRPRRPARLPPRPHVRLRRHLLRPLRRRGPGARRRRRPPPRPPGLVGGRRAGRASPASSRIGSKSGPSLPRPSSGCTTREPRPGTLRRPAPPRSRPALRAWSANLARGQRRQRRPRPPGLRPSRLERALQAPVPGHQRQRLGEVPLALVAPADHPRPELPLLRHPPPPAPGSPAASSSARGSRRRCSSPGSRSPRRSRAGRRRSGTRSRARPHRWRAPAPRPPAPRRSRRPTSVAAAKSAAVFPRTTCR